MQENIDDMYCQFEGMKVPSDIKPLPKFSRESLEEEVNKKRTENGIKHKVNISNKLLMVDLNCHQHRPNEVHINTCDVGARYKPDFDFADLDEYDAWRKTCKLKVNLQRFADCKVDLIRCNNFLHKMQVCETLTLFEEVHRMLKVGGQFLIEVLDIFKVIKYISEISPNDMRKLYHYEKVLYSGSDSTGMYYNRTIWTFDRLKTYLGMSNFSNVELNSKNDKDYVLSVKAWK